MKNTEKKNKKSVLDKKSGVDSNTKAKIRKKMIIYGLAIIVIFTGVLGISKFQKWHKANSTEFKIGNIEVTSMEYDFYYQTCLNNFLSSYGSYATAFGLDVEKPLDQQQYNDVLTWEDYFQQQAVSMIQEVKVLKSEADNADFKHDTDKEFNQFIEQLEIQAKANKKTLGEYLKTLYGPNSTESNIEKIMKEYMYSQTYSIQKMDSFKVGDEEIDKYYNDNKNEFDYVDYRMISVPATIKEDATADDISKAMADAKTKAEGIYSKIYDEESLMNRDKELNGAKDDNYDADVATLRAKVSYNDSADSIRQWLYDSERKEGSLSVVEDTSDNSYKIIYFLKRYKLETPTASVRHILISPEKTEDESTFSDEAWKKAEKEANEVYKKYTESNKTEEYFEELVIEHSKDTGSVANGGLYESFEQGTMVEDFDKWVFDTEHKKGDTGIVKTEHGYHIMYFVEQGQPAWKNAVQTTISRNEFNSWLNALKEKEDFKIINVDKNLTYLEKENTPTESE